MKNNTDFVPKSVLFFMGGPLGPQVVKFPIQRPQTRSATANHVSYTHERDLFTNQNIQFRAF